MNMKDKAKIESAIENAGKVAPDFALHVKEAFRAILAFNDVIESMKTDLDALKDEGNPHYRMNRFIAGMKNDINSIDEGISKQNLRLVSIISRMKRYKI